MKTIIRLLLLLVAGAVMGVARADEYVWAGGVGAAVWDATTANWSVNGGPLCAFQVGGDATFNSSATLTLNTAVNPKNVKVNPGADEEVMWTFGAIPFSGTESIVKTGAGTLTIDANGKSSGYNGNWLIQQGTMKIGAPNNWATWGTGSIVVESGATLMTLHRQTLGSPTYDNQVNLDLRGSLDLRLDSGEQGGNAVETLALNGGTITANCGGIVQNKGVFGVTGKVLVTGETAQVYSLLNSGSGWRNLTFYNKKMLEFKVDDVTKSEAVDLSLAGPFQLLNNSGIDGKLVGYRKTGEGSMRWSGTFDANNNILPDGDVDIVAGTVYYPSQQVIFPNTDATYTIGTNATLVIPLRNQLLSANTEEGVYPKPIFRVNGGTLRVGGENGAGTTDNYGSTYLFSELHLDNGTFDFKLTGVGSGTQGALKLGRLISMKGESPYVFKLTAGNAAYNLFADGTEFKVDDITGDADPDATFEVPLRDWWDPRYNNKAGGLSPAGLVKTGAGTMKLASYANSFSGDVDIREGTLLLEDASTSIAGAGLSYLGNNYSNRTVTVATGAMLAITRSNMLQNWSGTSPTGDANVRTRYLIKGTLKLADGSLNYFQNMTVDGGTFDLGSGYLDADGFFRGNFAVADTFKVCGSKAVIIPATDGKTNQAMVTGSTNVVFDVADVTGDSGDDLRFDIPVLRAQRAGGDGYRWGFHKRGAGTMRMTGSTTTLAHSALTGLIAVDEGALITDSDMGIAWVSSVVVAEGAAIGGSGVVNALTMSEGSGFVCSSDQVAPLSVKGNLKLPSVGTVDIRVADGTPLENVKVQVVKPTGTLTGDVSGWQVKINGKVDPNFRVALRNGTLTAGYKMGLVILLK